MKAIERITKLRAFEGILNSILAGWVTMPNGNHVLINEVGPDDILDSYPAKDAGLQAQGYYQTSQRDVATESLVSRLPKAEVKNALERVDKGEVKSTTKKTQEFMVVTDDVLKADSPLRMVGDNPTQQLEQVFANKQQTIPTVFVFTPPHVTDVIKSNPVFPSYNQVPHNMPKELTSLRETWRQIGYTKSDNARENFDAEAAWNENTKAMESFLDAILAKDSRAEPFHPRYKKNPKSFLLLIKQRKALEKIMRDYFKDVKKKLPELIKLDIVKAAEADDFFDDEMWDDFDVKLANSLADGIYPVYDNGANTEAKANSTGTRATSSSAPSQKFLGKYSLKLAGELNKTTKDDLKQAIQTSLDLGEKRSELTDRLNEILDDPYRSEMIAQTESIRAYTEGRLAVGRELGYEGKQWEWPGQSDCKICPALQDEGVIGIDESWDTESDSLGEVMGAPAHPWCQCSVKLVKSMDVEAGEPAIIDHGRVIKGGWITTANGNHIYIDDTNTADGKGVVVPQKSVSLGKMQQEHQKANGLGLLADYETAASKGDTAEMKKIVEKIQQAPADSPIAAYKSSMANLVSKVGDIHTEREAIDFSKSSTIKETLYHGSTPEVQQKIGQGGFKPDAEGAFGNAVYFTNKEDTAHDYGTEVTKAKVNVSSVKVINTHQDLVDEANSSGVEYDSLMDHIQRNYDAVEVKAYGYVAVFDPKKTMAFN